jgi:hypothetical protein
MESLLTFAVTICFLLMAALHFRDAIRNEQERRLKKQEYAENRIRREKELEAFEKKQKAIQAGRNPD